MNNQFVFTDSNRNYSGDVHYYKQNKILVGKLKMMRANDQINNEYLATFIKLKENNSMCSYVDEPKTEDWGITEEQLKLFLQTDRYVTATLLLKKLEEEKNLKINVFRAKTVHDYNMKKQDWKDFTKNMQQRYEKEEKKEWT